MILKAGTFWLFFSLMTGPQSTLFQRGSSLNYSELESLLALEGVLYRWSATEKRLKQGSISMVLLLSVSVEDSMVKSEPCIERRPEVLFISLMTFLIFKILLMMSKRSTRSLNYYRFNGIHLRFKKWNE